MSAALDISSARVSAEARGLARVFRDTVRRADAEFETVLSVVTKPLRERLRHHVRLREEQARAACLVWTKASPSMFRIGAVTTHPDRDALLISEQRITSTWLQCDDWDDDNKEPGVSVASFTLQLHRGRLWTRWLPSAIISAHALARRIERGADRTHAALVADLAVLAHAVSLPPKQERKTDADGDRVAAGDGFWVGGVVNVQGRHGIMQARAVRTFHFWRGRRAAYP
jgi:hypothetical protein